MDSTIKKIFSFQFACTLSLLLATAVQILFHFNQPITGAIVFLLGTAAALTLPTPKPFDRQVSSQSIRIPIMLWLIAIILRLHHLGTGYSIQDLSARFMYAAIQITHGSAYFPCIPQFEYDEVLISWLYVPVITLFGPAWMSFKITSVILSTSIVPAAYLFMDKFYGRYGAQLSSGFLLFSSYFQYCDPLIDMTRFTMVASLILVSMVTVENMMSRQNARIWILVTAFLMTAASYMHSSGRIVPVITIALAVERIIERSDLPRKTRLLRLVQTVLIFFLLMIPLLDYIASNPEYLVFKKRQIYGIHESYPFSWHGLLTNMLTVLGSFHYRAINHMLFTNKLPLMHPFIGVGSIGGIWLLIFNRHTRSQRVLLMAIFFTLIPLFILTPGHWRGLYFAAPVAMSHLAAGYFVSECLAGLPGLRRLTKRRGMMATAVFVCLILAMTLQLPWMLGGPGKPSDEDRVTRLYRDLEQEPDVPHYFSTAIYELKPGYAMFELFGSTWFSEYASIDLKQMKLLDSTGRVTDFVMNAEYAPEIRLVITEDDLSLFGDQVFWGGTVICQDLPASGLIVIVIRNNQ
ncbi:hypothetical protein JW823_03970 [bacterium]|nr:hypothetical protein [candidate division CSSED10-310 bacterium]